MTHKLIISIGRQFGSGGHEIAKKLGEKLNCPVFDNELIVKASEESGFSHSLFMQSDECKSLFGLSCFFTTGRYANADNITSENILFNIQSEVIKKIANKQSAIFVGRCSDYILRNYKNKLSIFITSPLNNRIARVCNRLNIDKDKAESIITKKDRERETYYNYYTLGNWGLASNYDLCIDSSVLGIDKTVDLIIAFIKHKNNGPQTQA